MKTFEGVKLQLHVFLTSALDGGKWSVPPPGYFTSGERACGMHWIGDWRGLRAGLDAMENRTISALAAKLNVIPRWFSL
jgi:hypothetical protein